METRMQARLTDDFLRIGYYREARKLFNKPLVGEAIDIGGNPSWVLQKLWPLLNWTYTRPYPEFDVQKMTEFYERNLFDYAFLDQVLEHVRNPLLALAQVKECLQPGGWIYLGTPFFIHYHRDPEHDFYRWTTEGLQAILTDAGFEKSVIGSWGNSRAAQISARNWATWEEIVAERGEEEARSIVEENDYSRPVICFAKAKKPGKHRLE